jgi:hypothetical protein
LYFSTNLKEYEKIKYINLFENLKNILSIRIYNDFLIY